MTHKQVTIMTLMALDNHHEHARFNHAQLPYTIMISMADDNDDEHGVDNDDEHGIDNDDEHGIPHMSHVNRSRS